MISYFLLFLLMMTFCGSLGATLFKKALTELQKQPIAYLLISPVFYAGCFCYVLGLVANLCLLRRFDYTLVYPCSALTYVWTMLIATVLLKERLNLRKGLATVCIVLGIFLMNARF